MYVITLRGVCRSRHRFRHHSGAGDDWTDVEDGDACSVVRLVCSALASEFCFLGAFLCAFDNRASFEF